MTQTQPQKLKIASTNVAIDIHNDDNAKEKNNILLIKPIAVHSNSKNPENVIKGIYHFFMDESMSSIPLCMRYFAVHELIVLMCGGIYYLQADIGVLCLSIFPGLSIICIFLHFIRTQFVQSKSLLIDVIFGSFKHYIVAICIFILGAASIVCIYHINTYLSTLVPLRLSPKLSPSYQIFIGDILKFPRLHSWTRQMMEDTKTKPFNFRISFVGSIIAPIIEESCKYFLLSLTFPIATLWQFIYSKNNINNGPNIKQSSTLYINYCIQSLFLMFIAVCGGCGIAIMENLGYLAACQWNVTQAYCLPNKNFDILGAGLARGIFSVPFHCVTACIMADIVCMWMNSKHLLCFGNNGIGQSVKFILSYPISIVIPVLFHSSFNYWMKGIPFLTGIVTICGFCFVGSRMSKKYCIINEITNKQKESEKERLVGSKSGDMVINIMSRNEEEMNENGLSIQDVEFLINNGLM